MYEVTIKKAFSAAHVLQEIGGKCEDLHGHNFTVEVSVAAEGLDRQGLLIDFRVLKKWTNDVLEELDHKCLNDVPAFKKTNPSSENVARFIFERIAERVSGSKSLRVSRVAVWESENAMVVYTGDS